MRAIKMDYVVGYGSARARAVRMARAPIVAFLEEHVTARAGWAEAMVQAHRGEWAGVGPEVHNPAPDRRPSDLIFLTGYGAWAPPLARGESRLIPGQNSAFKRDILLRYDAELDRLLEADILLQWKMRADGCKLFHEPQAQVEHASEATVRTIMTGYYLVMRFFAPLRADLFHWSPLKRVLRLLATPLAPFYRTGGLLTSLARRRSPHLGRALAGTWIVFCAHVGGAAGEAVGLLRGVPTHDRRFLKYEMNAERATSNQIP